MDETGIRLLSELDDNAKKEGVSLFIDGFKYMFPFTDDNELMMKLFLPAFEYSMIYVYLLEGKVAGFLGFGNSERQPVRFDPELFRSLFGKTKGNIIYKQLYIAAEKPAVELETDLYIDFLTTDKNVRGKGIATKLLNHVCKELAGKYTECHLDVLSKNLPALKLYEKLGFEAYKKKFNLFTAVKGLGSLVKMKKRMETVG